VFRRDEEKDHVPGQLLIMQPMPIIYLAEIKLSYFLKKLSLDEKIMLNLI
jgi:hypothetical protein